MTSSSEQPPVYRPTEPLPPVDGPLPSVQPPTSSPAKKRAVSLSVLLASILAGGAAGIGGSAWYDHRSDDSGNSVVAAPTGKVKNVATTAVEQVAAKIQPSVVKINVSSGNGSGSGSGIILSSDGKILTNNHVVALAGQGGKLSVSLNDGRTFSAKVIGTDPITDSAVIQAQGVTNLTPAAIGHSSSLKVGQTVVAIGSPYGLSSTVTQGIVSALNRPISVQESEQDGGGGGNNPFGSDPFQQQQQQPKQQQQATYPAIQTDAAINPGNSGGPLVDLDGQVVGVNASIQTATSGGSNGSVGLGFAIPIDELLPIANQIIKGEAPTHARLGVSVSDTANGAAQQGALITDVDAAGAAKSAIKKGDVIVALDDLVITGGNALVANVRGHRPGDEVTLTYIRGGQKNTVKVTLGSDASIKKS